MSGYPGLGGISEEDQEKLDSLPKAYMMALSDTTQAVPSGLSLTQVSIAPDGDTVSGPAFRHWIKEL